MKITSVKRQKRGNDRVNVHVDGEFRLAVAAEVAVRHGVRRGRDIDDAELAILESDDARWRAREAALHLLSFRQRSEHEVRQRLRAKGFDHDTIEHSITSLHSSGLLNDEAFAIAFARDRLRSRPSGRTRIAAELRAKGIDGDTASGLIDQLFEEGETELDLARRATEKFPARRGEDALRTRRRLYAYLGRRGFSSETIRAVLDEMEFET